MLRSHHQCTRKEFIFLSACLYVTYISVTLPAFCNVHSLKIPVTMTKPMREGSAENDRKQTNEKRNEKKEKEKKDH